ncbi:hypothetical protein TPA0598_08_00230 [Streptomyces lydicamycinicus]|uniref:Uncharacterized protein n=1 Tax=Streptomyces lydicamycinicus TaxID=1546107 RepID=A0A0P4RD54_9ACTN|nr:hypothetical protein TPA0598_08_00230 [Streptomyces lydicamycinicus]
MSEIPQPPVLTMTAVSTIEVTDQHDEDSPDSWAVIETAEQGQLLALPGQMADADRGHLAAVRTARPRTPGAHRRRDRHLPRPRCQPVCRQPVTNGQAAQVTNWWQVRRQQVVPAGDAYLRQLAGTGQLRKQHRDLCVLLE